MKPKPFHGSHWFLFVTTLLLGIPGANLSFAEISAEDLLQQFKEHDLKSPQAVTLVGTWIVPPQKDLIDDAALTYQFEVMLSGQEAASHFILKSASKLVLFPKGRKLDAWESVENGQAIFWRHRERWVFGNSEMEGALTNFRNYTVRENGEPTESDVRGPRVTLIKATSCVANGDIYIPLLTSGRGYARLISSIDSVKRDSETGLLVCQATGKFGSFSQCQWDLTIDERNQYLIRYACASNPKESLVLAVIRTRGQLGNSDHPFAAEGDFHFFPEGTQESGLYHVQFTKAFSQADPSFIDSVRKQMFPPYPENTTLLDHRVDPNAPPVDVTR